MHELRSERIDVSGRETIVLTAGVGEPLVFLHGGGIVEGFECFLPLAERFRFIAPQMPGFGGTALRPALSGIDDLTAHNDGVLDALGVETAVLVGHSLGGWAAASFAAAHPERVRRLVVAAPFGLDVPEHPLANVAAMSYDELFATLTGDPSVFAGRLPAGPDPEFDAARALEGRSLAGFVPGPFDPALAAKLASLEVPTMVQWGDDDRIVPVGHLPAWEAALTQRPQVRVYAGVGHLLFHEHAPAVADIAAFAGGAGP